MSVQILGKFISCDDQTVHRFITLDIDALGNDQFSIYNSYKCVSDEVFINYMNTTRTYADRDDIDLVLRSLYQS